MPLNTRRAPRIKPAVAAILLLFLSGLCGCAVRRIASPVLFPAGDPGAEEILDRYEQARASQTETLMGYQAEMTVAVLRPGLQGTGRASVRKVLQHPGELTFQNVQFEGDRFIKVNVISRILQEEKNGAQRENEKALAITRQNYSFRYLGERRLGSQTCHLFRVKPRTKTRGLFQGYLWIDAETFRPVRAEGKVANKPSWFLKRLSFVRDYERLGGYALPGATTIVSEIRLLGKFVSQINYRYQELQLVDRRISLPQAEGSPSKSASPLCPDDWADAHLREASLYHLEKAAKP